MYFSILNEGEPMSTGINSPTKREALADVLDFHADTCDSRADAKMLRSMVKEADDQALEILAASLGYEVEEHEEIYAEGNFEDDEE